MSYMIGVDVGGTFTDFSVFEHETGRLFHFKHSSTNYDSSVAIVDGIQKVLEMEHATTDAVTYLAHGTTVSTNALIEKKGARVGLITTEGFNDIMEIGIQKRPFMYDTLGQKPESLIQSGMNCGVPERIAHDGSVVKELDEEEARRLVRYFKENGVDSIAVCTLFSFVNPAHEKRIKQIIEEETPGVYTTISSELVPEFREYSRMSTTVLNAYLGPVMKKYVNNFQASVKNIGVKVEPYVTQSNGSIISIKETIECPIKTAVSGPSAGVIAAANIGRQCKANKIITFDMGGTSADISLIENFEAQISNERLVEGYPARIPMINIITIGAGGGSIAKIDAGGVMKVGPESAGAEPGPACYGRGGKLPTVTDANIYLGKLNQEKILGGRMEVYLDKAEEAIRTELCDKSDLTMKEAANGIISVVNSNMMRAIRVVSVEKGYDVREFSLMAFGGAGALHACEVSEELGIKSVLIPPSPGTLCSLGLLMADTKFDFCRTRIMDCATESIPAAAEIFRELMAEGDAMLTKEGIAADSRAFTWALDMRYDRQNYEITVSLEGTSLSEEILKKAIGDFHMAHERAYGYRNDGARVKIVSFRVSAIGIIEKPQLKEYPAGPNVEAPKPFAKRNVLFVGQKDFIETGIYNRNDFVPGTRLSGPAVIEQMDTTIVIPPRWSVETDGFMNLKATYSEVK
ncbi:MAG: hydantoinase/oxoprolinase family protein [Lachnospiraceae bacterium]|jgi:N-methylhydantoinase A|nr:hydantoinase/oxoprolinase family protein [Lachnospiraceae bacterium]